MRDHDQRPPLRGAVLTESQRKTHLQERICQDTRGMRGKARSADRGNEGRDQSGKGEKKTGGECVMTEGRPWRSPFNIWDAIIKEEQIILF